MSAVLAAFSKTADVAYKGRAHMHSCHMLQQYVNANNKVTLSSLNIFRLAQCALNYQRIFLYAALGKQGAHWPSAISSMRCVSAASSCWALTAAAAPLGMRKL
eukprot:scaffold206050_cov31-Prasinocladus_malaysianus.AAC.1